MAVDLQVLNNAVDFLPVIAAILAVSSAIVGVILLWKSAQLVLAAVRGGEPNTQVDIFAHENRMEALRDRNDAYRREFDA